MGTDKVLSDWNRADDEAWIQHVRERAIDLMGAFDRLLEVELAPPVSGRDILAVCVATLELHVKALQYAQSSANVPLDDLAAAINKAALSSTHLAAVMLERKEQANVGNA